MSIKINPNAIGTNSVGISKLSADIQNTLSLPESFDSTESYLVGDYCTYENKAYRFIVAHTGVWNSNDVVETSIFSEFTNIIGSDTEKVYIEVSSSDGQLTLSGIEIEVSFEDGSPTQILTTDSNGKADIEIQKGKVFVLTAQSQTGYQTLAPIKRKATSNAKYITFYYQPELDGYCSVTVTAYTFGAPPVDPTIFENKLVTIKLSNGESYSGNFDSTGNVNFPNVTRGLSGVVICPNISGVKKPKGITFSTASTSQGITVNYTSLSTGGFYITRDDGVDFDVEDWDATDTAVALHIATSTLQEENCDFYVKISDLCAGNNSYAQLQSSVWSTQSPNGYRIFPNVNKRSSATDSNIDYDGQTNTANMLSDAQDLNCSATSAEKANVQTLVLNNVTYNGFMGTLDQMRALFENQEVIYQICASLGKSASYYGKSIWTSTQHASNSGYAWYWYSGYWGGNVRSSTYSVLPLFAI